MDGSAIEGPASVSDVTSVACAAFQPIAWSVHDTDATIRQVKLHNASFTALCPSSAKLTVAK